MKLYNALQDFLYDKNYFVSIFEDKIYIYQYQDIKLISSEKIIVKLLNFDLEIKGRNLYIIKMNKEELMIKGFVNEVIKNEK